MSEALHIRRTPFSGSSHGGGIPIKYEREPSLRRKVKVDFMLIGEILSEIIGDEGLKDNGTLMLLPDMGPIGAAFGWYIHNPLVIFEELINKSGLSEDEYEIRDDRMYYVKVGVGSSKVVAYFQNFLRTYGKGKPSKTGKRVNQVLGY